MFAAIEWTALIGTALGLVSTAIAGWVAVRMKQLEVKAAAAAAAARRAELKAAAAEAAVTWITKGGPEW